MVGWVLGVSVALLSAGTACMAASNASLEGQSPTLSQIVSQIETRYDVPGFTADFHQVSTVKALDIRDEATGKMYVRRPGKMRWEYLKPDRQLIITNGTRLWVYRPADNQVMLGQAPSFFGDGKGAGFLSDIRQLRKKFHIMPADTADPHYYALKLKPLAESIDLAVVYLYASKSSYVVERVVTVNAYGDETQIDLINSRFDTVPDDDLFSFTIPEGTDVLTMDQ
jgi:outer membrane lipoprotein carrier protein